MVRRSPHHGKTGNYASSSWRSNAGSAEEVDVAVKLHSDTVLTGLARKPRQEGADQPELGKELGGVHAGEHDVRGL
jgi:hypothetical protein